jgi:hypothetical protein
VVLHRAACLGLLSALTPAACADSGAGMSSALGFAWGWLLLPLSGAVHHHVPDWLAWHARMMVAAWALCLPVGALAARFFKVMPGQDWPRELDNKRWWHTHRFLQGIGTTLMMFGLVLAWGQGRLPGASARWHALLGLAVCVLGLMQAAGGFARGSKGGPTAPAMSGDHYDMTAWRQGFERLHKGLGWLSLLLAVPVIALGLGLADAPRWMALALTAWWLLLAACFVRWQRQGRCIDTYQAIWGTDPRHPGLRIAPIGWGVRRVADGRHRADDPHRARRR